MEESGLHHGGDQDTGDGRAEKEQEEDERAHESGVINYGVHRVGHLIVVEDIQLDGQPGQAVEKAVQPPGEEPPPGAGQIQGVSGLGQVGPAGGGPALQLLQPGPGVQGGVVGSRPQEGAAHLVRPVQGGLVLPQGGQLVLQGLGQGELPRLQPADGVQVQMELPQQLDLAQSAGVLRGVVPIVVFQPPGGQEALLLIEADAGPGQAHQGLQLLDGHGIISFHAQRTLSSPFTVKRILKDFPFFAAPGDAFRPRGRLLALSVPDFSAKVQNSGPPCFFLPLWYNSRAQVPGHAGRIGKQSTVTPL